MKHFNQDELERFTFKQAMQFWFVVENVFGGLSNETDEYVHWLEKKLFSSVYPF